MASTASTASTDTATATATATKLVVISSSAAMPSSCRGYYRHVAVVEAEWWASIADLTIDERRRSVRAVLWEARRLHTGTVRGPRARHAFARAVREARAEFPDAVIRDDCAGF
jgi:hypothetical protein